MTEEDEQRSVGYVCLAKQIGAPEVLRMMHSVKSYWQPDLRGQCAVLRSSGVGSWLSSADEEAQTRLHKIAIVSGCKIRSAGAAADEAYTSLRQIDIASGRFICSAGAAAARLRKMDIRSGWRCCYWLVELRSMNGLYSKGTAKDRTIVLNEVFPSV